jgi:type II secretory pathway component HofQ
MHVLLLINVFEWKANLDRRVFKIKTLQRLAMSTVEEERQPRSLEQERLNQENFEQAIQSAEQIRLNLGRLSELHSQVRQHLII